MKKREFVSSCAVLPFFLHEKLMAQASIQRKAHEVVVEPGFEDSLMFVPQCSEKLGSIVVLHGSEGGKNGNFLWLSHWLASYGFVTLALHYSTGGNIWHAGNIARVSLDRTVQAMEWLKSQARSNGKVGLAGNSRGAEHALLVASLTALEKSQQAPSAIAVHAGTDVVARDFYSAAVYPQDPKTWPAPTPSWTWRQKDIFPGTRIEIEKFEGGIYLSHGMLDEVWAVQRTQNLENALRSQGKNPIVKYHPNEGHGLTPATRTRQIHDWVSFFSMYLF